MTNPHRPRPGTITAKLRPTPGLERGGPPQTGDEHALCEWISERVGRPVSEVRLARRRGLEARGITLTGDPELDAVRRVVELALDHGAPTTPTTPRSSRRRRSTTTTTTRTTTTDPATARAATYGVRR